MLSFNNSTEKRFYIISDKDGGRRWPQFLIEINVIWFRWRALENAILILSGMAKLAIKDFRMWKSVCQQTVRAKRERLYQFAIKIGIASIWAKCFAKGVVSLC